MVIYAGVDVGGTFADLTANTPAQNQLILHKLPSTPDYPDQDIADGVAQVLVKHLLSGRLVALLAHGTKVGTNALIQRHTSRISILITDGFRDLIEIGRQARSKVYGIHLDDPKPLVEGTLRHEVCECRLADGTVFRLLDEDAVRAAGRRLAAEEVDCVIVCFLHSYAYPEHEERAAAILAKDLREGTAVPASLAVCREFREHERFSSAALNGALLMAMNAYPEHLGGEVKVLGIAVVPKVSQSAGSLMSVDMARRLPIRTSLSGPAAGVLGSAHRTNTTGHPTIIVLDIGGTSADLGLLIDRTPTEVREHNLASLPLRLPVLDVNADGDGAGGRWYKDGTGGVQVHMTNTSNLPIKTLVNEYPLMIERCELVPDSGGPGTRRGGLGRRRVNRPRGQAVTFSGRGERFVNRPWGLCGGGEAATGDFEIVGDNGGGRRLGTKPSALEAGPEGTNGGDDLGRWQLGPLGERAAECLASGFSLEYLSRHYGQMAAAAVRRKVS